MNTKLIESFIEEHQPNGMAKLAVKANCSIGLLYKIRHGYNPKVEVAVSLARTLGVSLDDLCRPKKKAQ